MKKSDDGLPSSLFFRVLGGILMETVSTTTPISSYIIQSQDEEIKRIALELHEDVAQRLYSIYTGLQFIEKGMGSGEPIVKNYLGEMQQMMEKTIMEIRMLSVELHPPALGTLGLVPAIKSYAKLFTSTYGIIVEVKEEGIEQEFSEPQKIAIFRVCQEALINMAKYADIGEAFITFTWSSHGLQMVIEDKGKGFDAEEALSSGRSSGLGAMQERMLLAGGGCVISSARGKGTCIRIHMPF